MDFSGTYDFSLDAKNRLTVPARFRSELSAGVVISRHMEEPCLTIWRAKDYGETVAAALQGKNPLLPEVQKLKRFFHSSAFNGDLDSAGRVIVPPKLIPYAGIDLEHREVTVVGAGTNLELWDRATWAAAEDVLPGEVPGLIAALGDS